MIKKLLCLRCNHQWIPRKEKPIICPNPKCHSPYWNMKRNDKDEKDKN